jgi:hypothetical protein
MYKHVINITCEKRQVKGVLMGIGIIIGRNFVRMAGRNLDMLDDRMRTDLCPPLA